MKISETLNPGELLAQYQVLEAGVRLDAFLKRQFTSRSRQKIQQFIESGSVQVVRPCGLALSALKPSLILRAGDEVSLRSEKKQEPDVCFDYEVIYEDEWILVLDKPAGLPVHPAGRYYFNTLLSHLRTHRKTGGPQGEETSYFLVHRIDKETSGLMVLAKTSGAAHALTRQFFNRSTEKNYLAISQGHPEACFKVDLPLRRSLTSRIRMKMEVAPDGEPGQTALTEFQRLSLHGNYALLRCFLKTGRQHQIRVHLEAAGHPIVGDKIYGRPEEEALPWREHVALNFESLQKLELPRHALHAASLAFDHPTRGIRMAFESPLPEELHRFLTAQSTESKTGSQTGARTGH